MSAAIAAPALRAARRRLAIDSIGIWALAVVIGTIFGFTARQGGLSLLEAAAFSAILFAGASEFAAVGLVAVGAPWASIVLVVWLLNARHLLYAASIAPHAACTCARSLTSMVKHASRSPASASAVATTSVRRSVAATR